MSDVVSVVPEDMLTDMSRFAPLSPQSSPLSTEVVDQGVVEPPEFDAVVVPLDMSTITSQFSLLNPQLSPVSMESVDRVVVESLVSDDVPVIELDMLPDVSQFALLNPQGSQVSHLSLVQLSPNTNRVGLEFDMDTLDVFPVFVASPTSGGYFYPLSHLFRHQSRLCHVLHRLRALCQTRHLRHVTASSGVRPRRCLLQITQPTASSDTTADSAPKYGTSSC